MTDSNTWGISRDSGPRLSYLSSTGDAFTSVDEQPPTDARERAICRALLEHALILLTKADMEDRYGLTPARADGSSQ